jgi:hypothetical protein
MRKNDQQFFTVDLRLFCDGFEQGLHLAIPEQTVIDGQQNLFRFLRIDRHWLFQWLKDNGIGRERPMNARRPVVRGSAPHAVVDANRRCNVTAGETQPATRLRRIEELHRRIPEYLNPKMNAGRARVHPSRKVKHGPLNDQQQRVIVEVAGQLIRSKFINRRLH